MPDPDTAAYKAISNAVFEPVNCPAPPEQLHEVPDLTGLAMSGGGIRSATFNLGVLQGLRKNNLLNHFDYLSTVSGGGFTGSWWSAWLSRISRTETTLFPENEELEPARRAKTAVLVGQSSVRKPLPAAPDGSEIARRHDPIHFVRLFSNYLTPKPGALSPDTWRLVAFVTRNLLFTWIALLPLLLAAVMAAQAFYLADNHVAQSLLGAITRDSQADRFHYIGKYFELLFAAYATFSLLWLAHSSAKLSLALGTFIFMGVLGYATIKPILHDNSSGFDWGLVGVIVGCILLHVIQAVRDRERQPSHPDAVSAPVHATPSDHRDWLGKQQATLLKVGTIVGALLLIAGFSHDVVAFLFLGGDGVLGQVLRRAGGWSGALLALASAIYTAVMTAPSSDGTPPRLPGAIGKALMQFAPTLVVVVLAMSFAVMSRQLLMVTVQKPENRLLLAIAVVSLGVLQVVFGIFESYRDPESAPDEGRFNWKRFVPQRLLFFVSERKEEREHAARQPFYLLFSPRGWARLAALSAVTTVFVLARNLTLAGIWTKASSLSPSSVWSSASSITFAGVVSSARSISSTTVAVVVLLVILLVSVVPRKWKLALGSARPASLLAIAAWSAMLCLLSNDGVATTLTSDAFVIAMLWISVCVGGVIGFGWLADPNLLSMHAFYKARLTRAYLGASNTARENDDITDAAPGDDLKLTELWNHDEGGPYLLVNSTLSLVGGSDLATSQRSAENFIMSRYHCGSARAGYRCTSEYMSGQLSLGTAAAVSGAAVSPTMGSRSPSAAMTLLLSLLNVRLGFWAPTPSGRRWNEPHARLWPFYLLRETLANTGRIGSYCYLTDGGHFDNTGIYALVERGCRLIVVCDCGADPDLGFEDIGTAIRRCRIDFGTEIDLRIDPFAQRARKNRTTETHVVEGTIVYQPEHLDMLCIPNDGTPPLGRIIWIKPSVTALNAADVRQYARAQHDFPQQTTADQWYDESQFESYRRLGYESALAASPLIATGAVPAAPVLTKSSVAPPATIPPGAFPAGAPTPGTAAPLAAAPTTPNSVTGGRLDM